MRRYFSPPSDYRETFAEHPVILENLGLQRLTYPYPKGDAPVPKVANATPNQLFSGLRHSSAHELLPGPLLIDADGLLGFVCGPAVVGACDDARSPN